MPSVSFQPSGRKITVAPGVSLLEACRQAGFAMDSPCGGAGLCGKCRVRILSGGDAAVPESGGGLSDAMLAQGWRISCQTRIHSDTVAADPLPPIGEMTALTEFMPRRPHGESGLRGQDIFIRKNQAGSARLGLAVDFGTTTLAAALCDLDDGRILGLSSLTNPQRLRGDDVISRIAYAGRGSGELAELSQLAMGALEKLAEAALASAGLAGDAILLAAVAGNTVMEHLLLGVSPESLAASPFIPVFLEHPPIPAGQAGWRGEAPPTLMLVPGASAYVGGDIVAGLLAHDAAALSGSTLFLDIGTNGEMVLAVNGEFSACAAAAGPAFEGARIGQGMPAAPGAVCRVGLTGEGCLEIGVVGGGRENPIGICGTGLLDAAAVLLRSGLLDSGGRLLDREEAARLRPAPHPDLISRLGQGPDGLCFQLARPGASGGGVAVSQRDIREFQLAKGAVAAGAGMLLEEAGLPPGKVDRVLLAGGFGSYLSPASALAVGLLPAGIAPERITAVGNAALAGARLFLISEEERETARKLAKRLNCLELSGQERFQAAFIAEMLFPAG